MSKQQDAKDAQGYEARPTQRICSNCKYYTSRPEHYAGVFGGEYYREKDKRCTIGRFAVMKTACCKLHEFTADVNAELYHYHQKMER